MASRCNGHYLLLCHYLKTYCYYNIYHNIAIAMSPLVLSFAAGAHSIGSWQIQLSNITDVIVTGDARSLAS